MTIWLSRADVATCVAAIDLIAATESGFKQMDSVVRPQRIQVPLMGVPGAPLDAEAMLLLPGVVPQIPAYTVKVHSKYPGNAGNGLPAIQGVIHLFSSATGELLAIMDSPLLTAHRTAAAGAAAAKALARPDARSVAIIGAGVQGEMQFQYLRQVRNTERVYIYDVNLEAARAYGVRRNNDGYDCTVCCSIADAVRDADIVVSATWSREPLLFRGMIRPGTHVTTLGPDAPGKIEVHSEVVLRSKFVCDDKELAVSMGALNTFGERPGHFVTLTDVLRDGSYGRTNDTDITVFGPVGLPFQDLVAAWGVYEQATAGGLGQRC